MSSVLKLCVIVVVAAVVLARIAADLSAPRSSESAAATAVAEPRADTGGGETASPTPVAGEATLRRAADGHFYATARINGADVRFLVDTGATTIALSTADAERIGIYTAHGDYVGAASTANGTVRVAPVMLDSVELGGTSVGKVQAAVIAGYQGTSLLGQSFLSRFDKVSIDGDVMTLR